MVCTFIYQNKKHKRETELQQKQFQENLNITIANHNELMEISEEHNRIAISVVLQNVKYDA